MINVKLMISGCFFLESLRSISDTLTHSYISSREFCREELGLGEGGRLKEEECTSEGISCGLILLRFGGEPLLGVDANIF